MKSGKVVIVLRGRYAGRKAIIVKAFEAGTSTHKFPHALVVGIDKYPKKVTKSMTKARVDKRSKIKPFIKLINYNHLMPTRYQADIDLKKFKSVTEEGTIDATLDEELVSNPERKKKAQEAVKKVLEEAYRNQANRKSSKATEAVQFFYKKLRF